jgi:hypothetical protein
MNRAITRPQRSDKRQASRYHLFRLVPRAIQHSCEDYTLSVTVALRPVNATFSVYSFRCAPQKCLVPSEFTPQSRLSPRTTLLNGPTVARALRRPGAIGPKLMTTM